MKNTPRHNDIMIEDKIWKPVSGVFSIIDFKCVRHDELKIWLVTVRLII